MQLSVLGATAFADSGERPIDPALPTLVLVHGVVNDHSVWSTQAHWFATHGWNVLAVDLPGHGRSGGAAPSSVEQAADWLVALLDAAGVARAALAGHSWGSLIALQAAAQLQARATHLALLGTAYPMKVSAALLQAAQDDPQQALRTVTQWSRDARLGTSDAPGDDDTELRLKQYVLASNRQTNVLHSGLLACKSYAQGEAAVAALRCPLLFLLGAGDQMTPPRAAQGLIHAAQAAGLPVQVQQLPTGHNLMRDGATECLQALRSFLGSTAD